MKKQRFRSVAPRLVTAAKAARRPNILWTTLIIVLLAIIGFLAFNTHRKSQRGAIHKKALALGLFGAPQEVEERHVWVSEHPQIPGRNGEIPVHIMFRKDNHDSWELTGTGARLGGKYTNWVLTAYHVFEGRSGQYGCRKIGTNEFTGKEPIFPILSLPPTLQVDDSIICTINPDGLVFPHLTATLSTNVFGYDSEDAKRQYSGETWPAKIHFGTYPEKTIEGLLSVKVRGNTHHVTMDWAPVPGESGTVASVEHEDHNAYLVIIRGAPVAERLLEQLNPENRKRFKWSKDKIYGIGNLVKIE